ncbi:MAG: PIN domain-containing protein [bacterium]
MSVKRIYLDVCTLCRPFDNQEAIRVRLETDSVYLILDHVKRRKYELLVSPAHRVEIGATTHRQEDKQLLAFLEAFGKHPRWDMRRARERAEALFRLKLGPADAAHVAFAEQSAEYFITCDDALLRKCRSAKAQIPTMGPLEFALKENLK